jgi:uncharacterized protein
MDQNTDQNTELDENPDFWVGIQQFNQGEFYACHDTLEALWMEAAAGDRLFLQGILQIAVGLYHLGNGNCQGAMTLMGEGIGRLRGYEPAYCGIDVAGVRSTIGQFLQRIQAAGGASLDRQGDVVQGLIQESRRLQIYRQIV